MKVLVQVVLMLWVAELPLRSAVVTQEHLEEKAVELFDAARRYEFQGRASKALSKYESLVRVYPKTAVAAQARFQIARLYHANEEYENAFRAYEELIGKHPDSDLFLEAVEGEFQLVEEIVRRQVRIERRGDAAPNLELPKPEVVRDMMRVIMTQARYSEFAPRALYLLGITYQREDDSETARAIFERVNDEYPRSELSDDAAFQIAYLTYRDGLDDGFHRGHLRRARIYFEDFLMRYSGSDKVPEAKFCLRDIDVQELLYLQRSAKYYSGTGQQDAAKIYRGEAEKLLAKYRGDRFFAEAVDSGLPEENALGITREMVEEKSPHPPIVLKAGDQPAEVVQPE